MDAQLWPFPGICCDRASRRGITILLQALRRVTRQGTDAMNHANSDRVGDEPDSDSVVRMERSPLSVFVLRRPKHGTSRTDEGYNIISEAVPGAVYSPDRQAQER